MNKYKFSVTLVVEVDAFNPFDAEEEVRDEFGLGTYGAVEVLESEVGPATD